MASLLFPTTQMGISPNLCSTPPSPSSSHIRTSLSTGFSGPLVGGCVSSGFSGLKIRPDSINPSLSSSRSGKRSVLTMVIPYNRGSIWDQPPPDLASYLFKHRIVYLGMPLVAAVTELIVAEFMYLNYEDREKPIYFYINSTGTSRGDVKLGYEGEALAVYDMMRLVEAPIFTLCVGNAWGEAALLLAAGARGNRAALASTTIMIKQPFARFQGQASDVDIMRKEVRAIKEVLVKLFAKHTRKTPEQIDEDIRRPKYFSPSEAVEYGLIDKVLYNERSIENGGVIANIKKQDRL